MPRFKTVGFVQCENGHSNRFDIRNGAAEAEIARAYAFAEALLMRCKYCKTTEPMTLGHVFNTEQISLPIEDTVWGYTCDCGEKVEVMRIESGQTLVPIPPASKTVQCSKGHSRVIQYREFPSLERWQEETHREE
jgi:hypothetical protein